MRHRETRQLSTVYDVVRSSHDHPSAEEVFTRVRRQLPRVSLGTVYRNLQKLAEQERICLVLLGDRIARYDRTLSPHDHFLCEQCGAVADLPRQSEVRPNAVELVDAGYRVRSHAVNVFGLCPACAAATPEPYARPNQRLLRHQSRVNPQ